MLEIGQYERMSNELRVAIYSKAGEVRLIRERLVNQADWMPEPATSVWRSAVNDDAAARVSRLLAAELDSAASEPMADAELVDPSQLALADSPRFEAYAWMASDSLLGVEAEGEGATTLTAPDFNAWLALRVLRGG